MKVILSIIAFTIPFWVTGAIIDTKEDSNFFLATVQQDFLELQGEYKQLTKEDTLSYTTRDDVQVHVRQNPLKFYSFDNGWQYFIIYDAPVEITNATSTK